eukprot:TRINITY_DN2878_c0_g1_i2.p1 TRINITY_DN2878_c0_g1~~TRINITY_DN2878_c0_g1_i2.p1  ORF type:complete len:437 (-),score=161.43 TRINITY_DN2878_c0_g1_i2:201-1511(-)
MRTHDSFQVPVVFQDLRKEESYIQIFNSLQTLDNVLDQVFSKITNKVNEEKNKLNSISNRLAIADAKVKEIAKSTIAVTVLSPAKYPATEELSHFKPIYSDTESLPSTKANLKQSLKLNQIPHSPSQFIANPGDCLIFNEFAAFEDDFDDEGLGRLPENLPSVSSLLLFNSEDNPYKKYISVLDNLAAKDRAKQKATEAKKQLAEAPKSFVEGDHLPAASQIDVTYRPGLENFPGVKGLPSALPLKNVAQLNWQLNSDQSIAPSNTASNLPAVEDVPTAAPVANLPTIQDEPSTSVPSAPSAPPPPPPPSAPSAPPPPPPPSAPAAPPAPSAPPPPSAPSASFAPPDDDSGGGRNALLESIRNAGLRALKPSKDRPARKAPKPKKGSIASNSSMDLFSALKNSLMTRRTAMSEKQSGSNDSDDGGSISVPDASEWE